MISKVRLCHISDPHVGGRKGSLAVLDHLVGDAVTRGADHVIVTGDLLDRPFMENLRSAVGVFKRHGLWSSARCTLLPGNHDVSGLPEDSLFGGSRGARHEALGRFLRATRHVNGPHPRGGPPLGPGRPVLKRLGGVRLLCLSSVSLDDSTAGELRGGDLEAVRRAFERTRRCSRVVALHHQPYPAPARLEARYGRSIPQGLKNWKALLEVCSEAGVALILHGHLHTSAGPFDRRLRGVRVSCQGTARGELTQEGRRFGYDMYHLSAGRLVRRRHLFDSAAVVDGLLDRM